MPRTAFLRASALAAAAIAAFASTSDTVITLNPDGGLEAGVDGIRWVYGYGSLQAVRGGIAYFYDGGPAAEAEFPNNDGDDFPSTYIALAVADTVIWGTEEHANAITGMNTTHTSFDTYATTEIIPGASFHSVISKTLDGLTYSVTIDGVYTFPNEYVDYDITVEIPAGNSADVRFYMLCDSYLGGSDEGAGFHIGNEMIGVTAATGDIAMGYLYKGGVVWSGYQSAGYQCNADQYLQCDDATQNGHGPAYATDYSNYIDADPTTDNGFGVSVNLGSAPGTYTTSLAIFVTLPENVNALAGPKALRPRPYAIVVSLWIGFAFFALFALFALAGVCSAPKSVSLSLVVLINAITALAYLIMVLTDTSFALWCGDRAFDWMRYVAWGTVAPLTITLLATISGVPKGQGVFAALLSFIAVLALFAAAVSPICISAWPLLAFAIATGIILAFQLLGAFRAAAATNLPPSVAALFSYYVWALVFASAAYAIVWGTAEGGKIADATQEIITYTVLDIITKVVFNVFLLLGIRSYHQYGSCTAWLGTEQLDFDLKSV